MKMLITARSALMLMSTGWKLSSYAENRVLYGQSQEM